MQTKLIITNETALNTKYPDLVDIRKAIQEWIAADQKKGITSTYARIDNAAFMRSANSTPVTNVSDRKDVKRAVDDLHRYFHPDWAVILGSDDVVPHQQLFNPVEDNDGFVASDLPYACDVPYGERIEPFRFPTRAVTRLPDVTGTKNPSALIGLLRLVAGSPQSAYKKYFAVSASIFDGSTKSTLQLLFNNYSDLQDVPPDSPPWAAQLLGRSLHFFNCHGYSAHASWYGSAQGGPMKKALDSKSLVGQVTAGSVVATESCFGAELYDVGAAGGPVPICNTYLQNGAAAFFGSSNISYGQESSGDWADVFCEYCIEEMLRGETVGAAGLNARLKYARRNFTANDLKTLAQFLVFGDASARPVSPGKEAIRSSTKDKSRTSQDVLARQAIEAVQIELFEIMDTPEEFRTQLKELAVDHGLTEDLAFRSYRVRRQGRASVDGARDDPNFFSEIHTCRSRKPIEKLGYLIRGFEITAVGSRVVWTKEFVSH